MHFSLSFSTYYTPRNDGCTRGRDVEKSKGTTVRIPSWIFSATHTPTPQTTKKMKNNNTSPNVRSSQSLSPIRQNRLFLPLLVPASLCSSKLKLRFLEDTFPSENGHFWLLPQVLLSRSRFPFLLPSRHPVLVFPICLCVQLFSPSSLCYCFGALVVGFMS